MRANAAIALVQESRDNRGFWVVELVYDQGTRDAVEEQRSDALAGFVLAVFTVRDLVEAAFAAGWSSQDAVASNFDLYVYEGALNNHQAPIHASSTRGAGISNEREILSSIHLSGPLVERRKAQRRYRPVCWRSVVQAIDPPWCHNREVRDAA